MTTSTAPSGRSDARRNRGLLLDAARDVFAERGADATLSQIAARAGVSRTTLSRHFRDRDELAAVLYERNLADLERQAAELHTDPRGVVVLFDAVLDLQLASRTVAPVLSRVDDDVFAEQAARTRAAFAPLVTIGRRCGTVHPWVEVVDVLTAIQMAEATVLSDSPRERLDQHQHARRILRVGLFSAEALGY